MRPLLAALCLFMTSLATASQTFTISARGRTYTVTTTAGYQKVFEWDGHWLYEPSVVLPSAGTNGYYYLVFASNRNYQDSHDESIMASGSTAPYAFPSPPTDVLPISYTSNICDIADARPFWDGSNWHVYVQGAEWVGSCCPGKSTSCTGVAYVFEATGSTLTNLGWVYDSYPHAQRIVTPRLTTGAGIGEALQWYDTASYSGDPSNPVLQTYNDWGYYGQDCQPFNPSGSYNCYSYCPNCAFNGTDVFGYLSPSGTLPQYWWYYREVAYGPTSGPSGSFPATINPDVILGNDLDVSTLGNPGIGAVSRCITTADIHGHIRGLGFYNDPVPYPGRSPQGGQFVDGQWETFATDFGIGEARGFSPRFARNSAGYLDPVSNSPKTWSTFVYYNDAMTAGSNGCPNYGASGAWQGSQWFSVSSVTITEN